MHPFFLDIDDSWHDTSHCYDFYNGLGDEGVIISAALWWSDSCRQVDEGGAISDPGLGDDADTRTIRNYLCGHKTQTVR